MTAKQDSIRVLFYGRKAGSLGLCGLHSRVLHGMSGATMEQVIMRLYETHEHIDHGSACIEYIQPPSPYAGELLLELEAK